LPPSTAPSQQQKQKQRQIRPNLVHDDSTTKSSKEKLSEAAAAAAVAAAAAAAVWHDRVTGETTGSARSVRLVGPSLSLLPLLLLLMMMIVDFQLLQSQTD
jgi:hypothetical protein